MRSPRANRLGRPARVDHPDDLVARHRRRAPRCEVAFGQVQVRAAHATRPDPDPDLPAGSGSGRRTATSGPFSIGPGGAHAHACMGVIVVWRPPYAQPLPRRALYGVRGPVSDCSRALIGTSGGVR